MPSSSSDTYHHFCNLTLLENRVLVFLKVAFSRIISSIKHVFSPFAILSYVEQYSCISEITNITDVPFMGAFNMKLSCFFSSFYSTLSPASIFTAWHFSSHSSAEQEYITFRYIFIRCTCMNACCSRKHYVELTELQHLCA